MIITTTQSTEGSPITGCKGIVLGEAAVGANVFALITNTIGGRSGACELDLPKASAMGSDAILGQSMYGVGSRHRRDGGLGR